MTLAETASYKLPKLADIICEQPLMYSRSTFFAMYGTILPYNMCKTLVPLIYLQTDPFFVGRHSVSILSGCRKAKPVSLFHIIFFLNSTRVHELS